ncbi:hypothetical protein KQ939_15175 [Planococcus sp. CP5-4]|nr:hypothetical protein [Planococcus sp. CP5-4_YE]MBV0909087.1 hypothetical protein [Planococcus sp. CP5-4_UN]MBW6065017.1 hypothetical protein [Planococcus sp. CP5-4]
MEEKLLHKEFIRLCKSFNKELHIIPVLYGSLGLGKIAKMDFSPQDIDMLVPFVYLNEQWSALENLMERLGYSVIDYREHEFSDGYNQVGFSFIEDLETFAGVDHRSLEKVLEDGAEYYVLSLDDYLKIYTKSTIDGYRRIKNHGKDLKKIKIIRKIKEVNQ